MRKFIILCLMAFMVCSCYSTKTFVETCYGSVTAFTPQGDTLKRWDNAFIREETTEIHTSTIYGTTSYQSTKVTSNAFKSFGLNFTDLDTGKGVIVHNSIPFIIEYNTSVEEKATTEKGVYISTEKEINQKTAEEIKTKYRNYQDQIDANKKSMRKLSKDSDEYKIKKEQNDAMRGAMKDLDEQHKELTGSYIYQYPMNY